MFDFSDLVTEAMHATFDGLTKPLLETPSTAVCSSRSHVPVAFHRTMLCYITDGLRPPKPTAVLEHIESYTIPQDSGLEICS